MSTLTAMFIRLVRQLPALDWPSSALYPTWRGTRGRAVIGSMMSRARPSRPQRSKAMAAVLVTLTKGKTLFSDWLARLLQGRKRKNEQEREFYRRLGAYCRANNLSPLCEDDWKSAAYIEV